VRTLRSRIQRAARQHGVPRDVVEKDYAVSYVLAGVSSRPDLTDADHAGITRLNRGQNCTDWGFLGQSS